MAEGVALGVEVYKIASMLPEHERFGLTSQLRRGAVSVASNIAERYGRGSRVDYLRLLKVARGAVYELDSQMLFAVEFKYLSQAHYANVKNILDETERVLNGLIRSLEMKKTESPIP